MSPAKRSPAHSALGRAVVVERAKRGVSQEALGFRADIHRNHVGAIEGGELNPTYGMLLRLSRGLALPLSELIAYAEKIERVQFGPGRPDSHHGSSLPSQKSLDRGGMHSA